MKIQTVIFDVGNVLAAFRWKDYLEDMGYSPELQEKYGRMLFTDPLWYEWDRGVLTEEEITALFCERNPECRAEIHRILDTPYDLVREYPDSADWIREVHGLGCRVLLLSNYARKTFLHAYGHFDCLKLTDGGVISYQEKIVKPEPEIYRLACREMGLDPSECASIADNIKRDFDGAKIAGIGLNIWYATPEKITGKRLTDKNRPDYIIQKLTQALDIPELGG